MANILRQVYNHDNIYDARWTVPFVEKYKAIWQGSWDEKTRRRAFVAEQG